jgi:hypothetical protein
VSHHVRQQLVEFRLEDFRLHFRQKRGLEKRIRQIEQLLPSAASH